jgi:hypothetical protein
MYRSCIFCSAPLGSNESIERFPVGRSLAFDSAKGRLWAVCPRCARWNLAPIEERWEAMEDAERLFRDTRTRAQRENIGLARLQDGSRLIRVGDALAGELAAWRYGDRIMRRGTPAGWGGLARRIEPPLFGIGYLLMVGGLVLGALPVAAAGGGAALASRGMTVLRYLARTRRVVLVLGNPHDERPAAAVRRDDLFGVRVTAPDDGLGIKLFVPYSAPVRTSAGPPHDWERVSLVLRGEAATTALARLMVHVNEQGAPAHAVQASLQRLARAGSPDACLHAIAANGPVLATKNDVEFSGGIPLEQHDALALEMALHEETERRALDGELAMLEAMWREAEEIASIADRLPELPAPEPPRLGTEG